MKTMTAFPQQKGQEAENLGPFIGARLRPEGGVAFRVWAPFQKSLSVYFPAEKKTLPLKKTEKGYFYGVSETSGAGTPYYFQTSEGKNFPDPASRFQRFGVHRESEVLADDFEWGDSEWKGVPLEKHIFYELHIGAFTPEGTFAAAAQKLPYLKKLGVTAVEVMPLAAFPGNRNWGYDGVFPFAVQESYGGPQGFKHFVNEAHKAGLSVVLDVVYNHLGPEGNYLGVFAPYFSGAYQTGWGPSLNFDQGHCDEVRNYFTQNALMWLTEFHVDGLRLDAIHAIRDFSASPFLSELVETVKKESARQKKPLYLFPESDLNDAKFIWSKKDHGFGFDSQWSDDFHHALHQTLTDEKQGYYEDFHGLGDVAKAFNEGFVYSGQYSAYRKRRHGSDASDQDPQKFIVFLQNHDQVGNRAIGDRISTHLSAADLKLGAGCVLLSPFLPLLFMGEEYGETRPFPYFVSHTDKELVEAVRKGRARDFQDFKWADAPPDPQSKKTFESALLDWDKTKKGEGARLLDFYQGLISFRLAEPRIHAATREGASAEADPEKGVLRYAYNGQKKGLNIWFNFSTAAQEVSLLPGFKWNPLEKPFFEGELKNKKLALPAKSICALENIKE